MGSGVAVPKKPLSSPGANIQEALKGDILKGRSENGILDGRLGYFLSFLLGEGKGKSEAPGGGRGVGLFIEKPRRGGVSEGGGGGPRGREGVCGEFGEGGGAKFFFFGAEIPTKDFALKFAPENGISL